MQTLNNNNKKWRHDKQNGELTSPNSCVPKETLKEKPVWTTFVEFLKDKHLLQPRKCPIEEKLPSKWKDSVIVLLLNFVSPPHQHNERIGLSRHQPNSQYLSKKTKGYIAELISKLLCVRKRIFSNLSDVYMKHNARHSLFITRTIDGEGGRNYL